MGPGKSKTFLKDANVNSLDRGVLDQRTGVVENLFQQDENGEVKEVETEFESWDDWEDAHGVDLGDDCDSKPKEVDESLEDCSYDWKEKQVIEKAIGKVNETCDEPKLG